MLELLNVYIYYIICIPKNEARPCYNSFIYVKVAGAIVQIHSE